MGTSVSHGSPRTSNWKPVLASYSDKRISNERIISEIWRALENEKTPISSFMKTDLVFQCYNAVNDSISFTEALNKYNDAVLETKHNSIVAEFAKRVIPLAFQSTNPTETWKTSFFSELTNYVISRDASGFVGEKLRNKSINELIEFKKNINKQVLDLVGEHMTKVSNQNDWNVFIDKTILKLKTVKK